MKKRRRYGLFVVVAVLLAVAVPTLSQVAQNERNHSRFDADMKILSSKGDNPHQKQADKSAQDCQAMGGEWSDLRGFGAVTGCNLSTSDAGKACTDSRQCEGLCVRFTCHEWTRAKGCGIVVNGNMYCID